MPRRASHWAKWQGVAARAARAQAGVLFWLLYYLCVVPMGLVRRFAADPIDRDAARAPSWRRRGETSAAGLPDARRQS
jgi:hypothetical protein